MEPMLPGRRLSGDVAGHPTELRQFIVPTSTLQTQLCRRRTVSLNTIHKPAESRELRAVAACGAYAAPRSIAGVLPARGRHHGVTTPGSMSAATIIGGLDDDETALRRRSPINFARLISLTPGRAGPIKPASGQSR